MENSELVLEQDVYYVLKATQYSASKWRLMLFSKEKGRILVWFRNQSKYKQVLEPFNPLWLTIKSRPAGHVLEKIERFWSIPPLVGESLFAGWYLNELLLLLMPEEEFAPEVFDIYHAALNSLRVCSAREQLEVILREFEWMFLQYIGYGISLTHEGKTAQPIQPEKYYQCIPHCGLIESHQGFSGRDCLFLAEGRFASPAMLLVAKQLMRILIDSALGGRVLQTRELFKSLYKRKEA